MWPIQPTETRWVSFATRIVPMLAMAILMILPAIKLTLMVSLSYQIICCWNWQANWSEFGGDGEETRGEAREAGGEAGGERQDGANERQVDGSLVSFPSSSEILSHSSSQHIWGALYHLLLSFTSHVTLVQAGWSFGYYQETLLSMHDAVSLTTPSIFLES